MASSEQSASESTKRRASFLDFGGPNSLSNFASSLQRAQMYLETSLPDPGLDSISPCTSRESAPDLEQGLLCPDNSAASAADYGSAKTGNAVKNDLNSFQFPQEDVLAAQAISDSAPDSAPRSGSLSRSRSASQTAWRRRESSLHTNLGSGRSTAPQTVFNAVNTLMGIAMLSLPFGLRLSGWVLGVSTLLACAWVTAQTAKILGSVLKKHKHVHSYADIAYLYGGNRFLAFATATFVVDLLGASLSLILIFSDSFSTLFPAINSTFFKLAITAITLFFSFLPLSLVSLISVVGIICTVGIFATIVACGLMAPSSPGSLLHPTSTSLWPSSGPDFLLSLGIFMAPWGGHPVFPELYRDMRHPSKYNRSCNVTFSATIVLDLLIAAVGYLMFGSAAEDSVTKNIIAKGDYPDWVRSLICLFLGILPVCKLALVTRPVISVYESQLSISSKTAAPTSTSSNARTASLSQIVARVVFMAFLFALSIAFTSFGKVVAFLGSAICFTICVTLPLLFHLKLNANELTPFSAAVTRLGVAVGVMGAVLGTYGSVVSSA
ncbi:hypothetical protein OXX79_002018 [Metschnikowia pulcherrima]